MNTGKPLWISGRSLVERGYCSITQLRKTVLEGHRIPYDPDSDRPIIDLAKFKSKVASKLQNGDDPNFEHIVALYHHFNSINLRPSVGNIELDMELLLTPWGHQNEQEYESEKKKCQRSYAKFFEGTEEIEKRDESPDDIILECIGLKGYVIKDLSKDDKLLKCNFIFDKSNQNSISPKELLGKFESGFKIAELAKEYAPRSCITEGSRINWVNRKLGEAREERESANRKHAGISGRPRSSKK